jgi:hypothetical protein
MAPIPRTNPTTQKFSRSNLPNIRIQRNELGSRAPRPPTNGATTETHSTDSLTNADAHSHSNSHSAFRIPNSAFTGVGPV